MQRASAADLRQEFRLAEQDVRRLHQLLGIHGRLRAARKWNDLRKQLPSWKYLPMFKWIVCRVWGVETGLLRGPRGVGRLQRQSLWGV